MTAHLSCEQRPPPHHKNAGWKHGGCRQVAATSQSDRLYSQGFRPASPARPSSRIFTERRTPLWKTWDTDFRRLGRDFKSGLGSCLGLGFKRSIYHSRDICPGYRDPIRKQVCWMVDGERTQTHRNVAILFAQTGFIFGVETIQIAFPGIEEFTIVCRNLLNVKDFVGIFFSSSLFCKSPKACRQSF